jgi:CHAT domain-containing protein
MALHQRYRSAGDSSDLHRATTLAGWALAATPATHPDWARIAMDVAAIHLTRHAHTGVLADLTRAIELGVQALRNTPTRPPEWLATLGTAFQRRYQVTGDGEDLDGAVELGEQSLTGEDFALPGRQARVSSAYWRRHHHAASQADLDRAIDLLRQAVAATPADHVDLPELVSQLAITHLDRHRLHRTTDADTAVTLGERALAILPAGHASRARLIATLCAAQLERVIDGEAAPTLDRLHEWERALAETPAAPVDRVSGYYAVGALAQAAGHDGLAVTLLDTAVTLLHSLPPRETGWTDQQHRMGEHVGLVSAAVAAHCATGDPAGAVEIAELGRGILLATQANIRVDLDELTERVPRLADRFRWVCDRLNTPDFPADERKGWWADYDRLLADIRAEPGMADFIAPPRFADLRPVAASGSVVLVNAGRRRGDAVIIRDGVEPVLVALPDLNLASVEEKVTALLDVVAGAETMTKTLRRRRVMPEVLAWLWDTIIAPIAGVMVSDGPHRVWWLPTGLLGLLPLHAAGYPGQSGALDVMISSYVPSLRVLRQARNRRPATRRDCLTVAMSHVPDRPDLDLPGAAAEANILGGRRLIDDEATAGDVLAAIQHATWAHFACHGVVDPVSQADSGLVLHDSTLRLSDIGGQRLTEAELAYLSACSTANHGIRYADEVLHVASAFQLAGFRHVIASLWPLSDDIATTAADAFYHALPDTPGADDAAATLREVTLRLRDHQVDYPYLWASLIHSGP